MLSQFDKWQTSLTGKIKFIFISNSDAADNRAKFGGNVSKLILLQKGSEIADVFRAKWTPMAVLMDAKGRVASFTGAGDLGITDLAEQLSAKSEIQEFTYFVDADSKFYTPVKIGENIPDISMKDINGKTIDRSYFTGKPTLVTFWSPTCSFCEKMMDDIREWDASKNGDSPNLLIFADGDKDDHLELGLKSPLILDTGMNTAASFGMFSTPSAIMVDEDGKFVSETAIGAADIWALIGKRK